MMDQQDKRDRVARDTDRERDHVVGRLAVVIDWRPSGIRPERGNPVASGPDPLEPHT